MFSWSCIKFYSTKSVRQYILRHWTLLTGVKMIFTIVLVLHFAAFSWSSSPFPASHNGRSVSCSCTEEEDQANRRVNHQGQLLRDLYGKIVMYGRPVFNTNTVTNVTYRLLVHELVELDARNQRITISALLKQTWKDEFLTWNQSEYGGIKMIQLPSDTIWVPDITLHRNIDGDFERIKNTRAAVSSDGTVEWFAPAIFTSPCRIRVRYFPFDTQECVLKFGSWAYHGFEVDLYPATGEDAVQDRYMENGVWDLKNTMVVRNVTVYKCCPEVYPELIYTLTLKRRSNFYILYLLLPCVFLSGLSLLVFYLPPECGEKLTLSITNLLALVVFQQVIVDSMPPSGEDPPLLGDYFLAMIIMVCLSVVTTVFVIRVSAKSGSVPGWVQWLFLRSLTRVTCMHRAEIAYSPPVEPLQLRNTSTIGSALKLMTPDGPNNNTSKGCLLSSTASDDLRFIRRDLEERNNDELRLNQWKHVARVIDRCLLLIFLVYATVTSSVLIWRATGMTI